MVIDRNDWIFLYYVVEKKNKGVCLKLLEYEVLFDVCGRDGIMLFILVYNVIDDDIVVMFIKFMDNEKYVNYNIKV